LLPKCSELFGYSASSQNENIEFLYEIHFGLYKMEVLVEVIISYKNIYLMSYFEKDTHLDRKN